MTPSRLNAAALRAALPPDTTIGQEILVFEETDSTNDLARRAGDDGIPEGLVIFAESQRAGRGTQGRQWSSPPAQGLCFSVLLRPRDMAVARWPELTFCAALAVAESAELATGRSARIKWPNDVLLCDRKVAGILVECHHRQSPGFVVLGIGLNVLQRPDDFDPKIRESATSLAIAVRDPGDVERHRIGQIVLERLEYYYSRWPTGFPAIMDRCKDRGCLPPADNGKTKDGPITGPPFDKEPYARSS